MAADWEVYYEAVSHFYIYSVWLTTACALVYLLTPFLRGKRQAVAAGAAYLILIGILYYYPVLMSGFTAQFFALVGSLAVMCFLDRRNYLQKIFLTVTFFTLRWLVARVSSFPHALLFRLEMHLFSFGVTQKEGFFLFVAETFLELIFDILFFAAAVVILRKTYRYKQDKMEYREFFLLMIPSFTGMLIYAFVLSYDNLYSKTGNDYYDAPIAYLALGFLLFLAFYATIIIFLALYQNIRQRQEEMKQKEQLAGQVEEMRRHIRDVEKLYQEIRGLKHDMGNHIMVLESLYADEKKKKERLTQYLADLKRRYQDVTEEIKTGNPVTDVILTQWGRAAEEKGITFDCDFCYPKGGELNAFDVSVILNNALQNAIDAASQKGEGGYVRLRSRFLRQSYLIEIENNYEGELVKDKETGLFRTTKPNRENHGYGLSNIREVAQKYYGDMDIETEGGIFRLSVFLQTAA